MFTRGVHYNIWPVKDLRLRDIFDLVAQYWAQHPPKKRKTAAPKEVQEEEAEMADEGEAEEEEAISDDEVVDAGKSKDGPAEAPAQQDERGEDDDDDGLVEQSPAISDHALFQALGARSPNPPSAYVCPRMHLDPPEAAPLPKNVDDRLQAIEYLGRMKHIFYHRAIELFFDRISISLLYQTLIMALTTSPGSALLSEKQS